MNRQQSFFRKLFTDSADQPKTPIENRETFSLWGTGLVLFVICRWVFMMVSLPAVPHISSILIGEAPLYGILVVCVLYVIAAFSVRLIVGGIRPDAPLFCAALALLALPTRGGDIRNALLDAGSRGVFIRMIIELVILWIAIVMAACLTRPLVMQGSATEDSTADRLTALVGQAIVTLVLLSLIGQSPMKGQAIIGVAVSGAIATLIMHQYNRVSGGFWYVSGTMLAGVIAYVLSYFSPAALPIGDTSGFFAGAARSLPLHYATAGVVGTLYGYWKSESWNTSPSADEAVSTA